MFGVFFFIVMGLYLIYYLGMIGYDLYVADKMERGDSTAQVVDVSAAASSYKPKDVRTMLDESGQRRKKSDDAATDDAAGGGRGVFITNQYPEGFSVNNLKDMFVQQAQTGDMFEGLHLSI